MSDADLLRRAASRLLEAAYAADTSAHTFWTDPWKAEDCIQEYPESPKPCPCIVSQGDLDRGAVQYIADAETPEYATWIAMMSTQLAEPLAKMLEERADAWDSLKDAVDRVWDKPTHENEQCKAKFLDEARPKFADVLKLARLIVKEEESS